MQYCVDILTKIYVLEIICLQLFRLAIDGLKYDVVKGKTGMAEPPTDYLNIPTLSYRSKGRNNQHKVRNEHQFKLSPL